MNRWMEELIEWTGEWMTFFQFRIEKKKTLLKLQVKKTWLKCYLRGANRIHHSTGGTKFKFQKIHNDNSQKNHLGVKSTWLIEMSK